MQFSSEDVAVLRLQVVQSMLEARTNELSEARDVIKSLLQIIVQDENDRQLQRIFPAGELETIHQARRLVTS